MVFWMTQTVWKSEVDLSIKSLLTFKKIHLSDFANMFFQLLSVLGNFTASQLINDEFKCLLV